MGLIVEFVPDSFFLDVVQQLDVLFCNSNFENTYDLSILFYICTGSMGAPVESQQHIWLTMADNPLSVALPLFPPPAACFTNTGFKDVTIKKNNRNWTGND